MASLPYKLFKTCNQGLVHLERIGKSPRTSHEPHVPIFIVGPPRTGSTFLYQLLINVFGFSYLSNLHCWLYGAPGLVERYLVPLYNLLKRGDHLPYHSNHGHTPGLLGPSECAEYWYRFFPRTDDQISSQFRSESTQKVFRNSIFALIRAASNSLLFKNLYNSFRIASIKNAMPNALFIEIRREPLDTGHSILKHRLQQTGSYQNWWSVPVPGMDALLKKSPEEQVLEQIWRTYRHIASMKEKFGQASFHVVKYGDLTKQPESTLQKIHQFFHQHGVDCKADFRYLPEARKKNRIVEIDQSMYRALQLKSRDYNLDDL